VSAPSALIHVSNHGPVITSTDYFDSELARAGKIFCSVNGGAIRVLLPPAAYGVLNDMRAGKECVLSRGPWPAERKADAVEILWDDGSDSPFVLHLTPESFDLLPAEPEPGREWICDVYVQKDGSPHRAVTRPCHWRRVSKIPCMEPWT